MATEQPPLWLWQDLQQALHIEPSPVSSDALDPKIQGLAFDSRKAQPNDLFVALPGDPGPEYSVSQRSDRDGHHFVDAAAANGAVAAMTHDGLARALPQLAVEDTLEGLRSLAIHRRDHSSATRVAITGSSGKTTAKTLLAAALAATGATHASQGSFNNHLGVPLSLATMPLPTAYGVFEIGTNHPGEIAPLSQLVAPNVAVLLNVHLAHVGNFADLAALRAEKCAIAAGLCEGGALVVSDLVELPPQLAANPNLIRFGESAAAQIQLVGLEQQTHETRANYRVFGQLRSARVPGGGLHRAQTLGAVLAVLTALGLDLEAATELPDALVPQGRGNLIRVQGRTLLDDSYNANPQSMRATLEALLDGTQHHAKRYALLGEMLELGDESAGAHAGLADYCRRLDGVWLVGDAMAELAQSLPDHLCLGHWPSVQDASAAQALLAALDNVLAAEDVLLIKGSQMIFWQQGFVKQLTEKLDHS